MNRTHSIYLVFSKTGTWLSRTLNLFSKTKYVHSSIGFDDTFQVLYSFGRINPNNPFSGGFVRENLHDGVYKKWAKSECIIFKVPVTGKQYYDLMADIEFFYANREHYRYNFIGLFGILLNRPIIRKNHFFCSQFVYYLLKKNELLDLEKHPELVQTIDLFEIKDKHLLYEGYIAAFDPKTLAFDFASRIGPSTV